MSMTFSCSMELQVRFPVSSCSSFTCTEKKPWHIYCHIISIRKICKLWATFFQEHGPCTSCFPCWTTAMPFECAGYLWQHILQHMWYRNVQHWTKNQKNSTMDLWTKKHGMQWEWYVKLTHQTGPFKIMISLVIKFCLIKSNFHQLISFDDY